MADLDFSANCSQCFGLCCVALSFERSAQFGHDKLAGQPCHHLASDFRCRIHERREELGYEGCEAFDCLGAGQRASAAFGGQNWQRDTNVARRLYARFSQLLRLQEMRQALKTAETLEISAALHERREGLLERIGKLADCHDEDVGEAATDVLNQSKAFLKGLAPELAQ